MQFVVSQNSKAKLELGKRMAPVARRASICRLLLPTDGNLCAACVCVCEPPSRPSSFVLKVKLLLSRPSNGRCDLNNVIHTKASDSHSQQQTWWIRCESFAPILRCATAARYAQILFCSTLLFVCVIVIVVYTNLHRADRCRS